MNNFKVAEAFLGSNPWMGWLAFSVLLILFLIFLIWEYRSQARLAQDALLAVQCDPVYHSEERSLLSQSHLNSETDSSMIGVKHHLIGSESDETEDDTMRSGPNRKYVFPKHVHGSKAYRYA